MSRATLTKNELKREKENLKHYRRFLPSLNIKKQQLMREIIRRKAELAGKRSSLEILMDEIRSWAGLLLEDVPIEDLVCLKAIELENDNIAGIDIPVLNKARIDIKEYDLFSTPLWVDSAIAIISQMIHLSVEITILELQIGLLKDELRTTTQRVNLLEKVKIPEALKSIRRISIYLGDQQTASIVWARMAKEKIQGRKSI